MKQKRRFLICLGLLVALNAYAGYEDDDIEAQVKRPLLPKNAEKPLPSTSIKRLPSNSGKNKKSEDNNPEPSAEINTLPLLKALLRELASGKIKKNGHLPEVNVRKKTIIQHAENLGITTQIQLLLKNENYNQAIVLFLTKFKESEQRKSKVQTSLDEKNAGDGNAGE